MVKVTGINHITLATKDLNQSVAFYRDILGMDLVAIWDNGAYFLAGELWFCLSLDPLRASEPWPEYTHVAFDIPPADFPAMVKKLQTHQVPTWKKNESEGESIYILDLDQHKLEIHTTNLKDRLAAVREKPYAGMKLDDIHLERYNPEWPKLAALEIEKLKNHLPQAQVIDIQHVGSTAIPQMLSKPIIDIQVLVDTLEKVSMPAIKALERLGYQFWRDNPDKMRMFFVKGMPPLGAQRTHHVHIVEKTSPHWQEKILFRDYLRQHADAAKAYEELKKTLLLQYRHDREKYTEAKTNFVQHVLKLARDA